MIASHADPTVQRRRLATELRRTREAAGLTRPAAATKLGWTDTKLVAAENGRLRPTDDDVRTLLSAYDVTNRRRISSLVDVARQARVDAWSDFRDVASPAFLRYLDREPASRAIRHHEVSLVPGLLQTEGYALALLTGACGDTQATARRRWRARHLRQSLHQREEPPAMSFTIGEPAIDALVGGREAMGQQLDRLLALGDAPHVTLRVIPGTSGATAAVLGPVVHLEHEDTAGPDLVYLEGNGPETATDDPAATARYLDAIHAIEEVALSPDESAARIRRSIEALHA